jgi:L-alanine-DL-glutamate epimerase-like enolase superfamily enzyme
VRIVDFRLTRFQFARDRIIGDSQVRVTHSHVVAIELVADTGAVGLGFGSSLFHPLPPLSEIERVFREEAWDRLRDQPPAGLVHRVSRPRGGNRRATSLPLDEGIGQACWDLAAKEVGLPLWRLLGGTDPKVRVYASGLDYHLSDADFVAFFKEAARQRYRGFKIKVGHADVAWDLRRLHLLKEATGGLGPVMIDSNEAWSPKEALRRLDIYRREGFDILWAEDPILRDDFAGLAEVRAGAPWVQVNSGEYLDLRGKRLLLEARGADMLNVHGSIGDVMRAGWLAAEHGIPVTLGNTMLEMGVHMAAALPEVPWLEYSFQNQAHLVETPYEIRDSHIIAPDRPGHGLTLSEAARRDQAVPDVRRNEDLPPAPQSSPIRLGQG